MAKDNDNFHLVSSDKHKNSTLPPMMNQVKGNTLSILVAHLENLFSSCDDLFFDLSSRATSNSEQNLYFESMREVRLKKNGAIAAFKRELDDGFYNLPSVQSPSTTTEQSEANPNTLSLVQNDTLEQDVAISNMVTKARANCQESLYHLNLRFDYLVANTTINESNNPMDPQQLCKYFASACELFELNIKARIIIFKQFDRLVVSKLANIYSTANNLLIEAGVLPKTTHKPKAKSSSQPKEQGLISNQDIELEFNELSNILASIRDTNLETLPNYVAYSNNPGPALANTELVNLLTSIQQNFSAPADEQQLAENLRIIIGNLLSNHGNEPQRSLHQPEEDVINLVAMFFDFIIDDRNLPVPVQALISRLQIPVLKIALKDKTFFSDGSHPARKLINTIADVSIGWDDSDQLQKDRLYEKISNVVLEISEQYQDNDNILTIKLEEMQQFIDQMERKSSIVQKRSQQVAEGQAKTKLAKEFSQKIMLDKLKPLSLPEAISEFLTKQWLNLMVITHLKHGTDSPEWINVTQTIDDLAWASQPHSDTKSLQRFEKIKPELLNQIEEGLSQITDTKESAAESIKNIEESLNRLQENSPDIEFLPLSTSQVQELGHTPGSGSTSWKDMTGIERQQARYKELTYEFIRKAEELPLNTWVSYTDIATGKTLRCKLSSKIDEADTYIFVNRFGFIALEKLRKDFANDMQAGRAVILEDGQLFDRAMSKVLARLKPTTA